MVVDFSGNVLFADGRRLRMVNAFNGSLITVAGTPLLNQWQPPDQCDSLAKTTSLRWPTDLTLNPIDQSVYFLDGEEILILKSDGILLRLASCSKYLVIFS